MSEQTGIVTLEELPPKEFYLRLKSKFVELIKRRIREKYKIEEICDLLAISDRMLLHWLNKESLLRLDIFKKIINFFDIKTNEVKILSLRGKKGKEIKYPKLPFNFTTTSGVRIIAAILGDGSLSKSPSYANKNKDLIRDFIKDCLLVFGNINLKVRPKNKVSNVKVVDLPCIFGKILKTVGLKLGSKVDNNPNIPSFIFNLEKEKIIEFLSQIIDDEGSVSLASRHIRIKFSTLVSKPISNLIDNIKELLLKIGIESVIYQLGEYDSKRGERRKNWQIEIHYFEQLQKIYKTFKLRNKERKNKINGLLQKHKLNQFPKKKTTEIFLSAMKKVQEEKGYFTTKDLIPKFDRSGGHIKNMVHKYESKKLIKKLEVVKSNGKTFFPAKYVISE